MIKEIFLKLFNGGSRLNEKNIIYLCNKYGKGTKWLDVGCDDGTWTLKITHNKNVQLYGVEVVKHRARIASKKGIAVSIGSLEKKLPYQDGTFDLVHSNQVIEHLYNLDIFVSEIRRVLKKNGILIISTENPASWHNIFALVMGWQMFTTTNISAKKRSIGNPLAIHSESPFAFQQENTNNAWEHNKTLTPRALTELLKIHSFHVLEKIGAGYHPLPAFFGKLDTNHSHFYVVAAQKK